MSNSNSEVSAGGLRRVNVGAAIGYVTCPHIYRTLEKARRQLLNTAQVLAQLAEDLEPLLKESPWARRQRSR